MYKLSITEYDSSRVNIRKLAKKINLQEEELKEVLIRKGEELKDLLMLKKSPVEITDNHFRMVEIAGIININNLFIIEVAPKFLGNSEMNQYWREDFLFVSILSKYGKILDNNKIIAGTDQENNFYTLLANIMIEMYEANSHRPIRNYQKIIFKDFSLDAEFEAEEIIFPDAEGFEQYDFILSKQNQYNEVISLAFHHLANQVNDYYLKVKINKIISNLTITPSIMVTNPPKRIPNRNSSWKSLYNLCLDIINGSGLALKSWELSSLGYVVNTWRVWEDVLSIALVNAYGHNLVKIQKNYTLGTKCLKTFDSQCYSNVNVRPDIVVYEQLTGKPFFILDAKYKGNSIKEKLKITSADLYEALAFAKAVNCDSVFLAYPSSLNGESGLGDVEVFEIIEQDLIKVIGIKVIIKGISGTNAFKDFIYKFQNCLEMILSSK